MPIVGSKESSAVKQLEVQLRAAEARARTAEPPADIESMADDAKTSGNVVNMRCRPSSFHGLLGMGKTTDPPGHVTPSTLIALDRRLDDVMRNERGFPIASEVAAGTPLKALANAHGSVLLVSDSGALLPGGEYLLKLVVHDAPMFRRLATTTQEGAFGISIGGLGAFQIDRATLTSKRILTDVELGDPAYLMNAWSNERWILFLGGVDGGRFLIAFDRYRRTKRVVAVGGSRREGSLCGQPLASDAVYMVGQDGGRVYRIDLGSGQEQSLPVPMPLDTVECLSVNANGDTIVVTGLMEGITKTVIGDGHTWNVLATPELTGIVEPVVGEDWVALRDPANTVQVGRTGIVGAGAVFLAAHGKQGWNLGWRIISPSPQRLGSFGFEFAYTDEELYMNYFDVDVEALTMSRKSDSEIREALWSSMRICGVSIPKPPTSSR
ncbi:MAG: hypothetical protein QM784_10410 [Polyangiaceae bacterium]